MAVGVGAGVNLGSATGYLFVDPKGVATGLNAAASQFKKFEAETARIGEAMAATTAAANAAIAAQSVVNPASIAQLAALQTAVQQSIIKTTQVYRDEHGKRATIVAESAQKEAVAQQAFVDANVRKLAAENAVTAALEREALAQANLNAKIASGATARQIGFAQGTLTLRSRDVEAAKAEVLNAITAVDAAEKQLGASLVGANTAITQSIQRETLAANELTAALKVQQAERQRLATSLGSSSLLKLATDAEKASARYIAAINAQLAAEEKLQTIQVRRATTTAPATLAKLADQEIAATAKLEASRQSIAAMDAALIRTDQAFTAGMIAESEKRIAAAEEEAAALTALKANQQKQATERLAGAVTGAATKGLLGFGAAIALSTVAFASFEQQMINVQSITGNTDQQISQFSKTIQDLAVQLGQSPVALANGLYVIVQAGFSGAKAMQILGVAAKAATAGLTDVETAALPLIATINAYGLSVKDAKEISDVLFESATLGVFSFKELATQLGDNVPLASQLGVKLEELGAAYVVLTRQGNSLSESTTQVNGILRAFLKPTDELAAAMRNAGFETGEETLAALGLGGALALATNAAHGSTTELTKMFPLIRGLRGVVALSKDDFNQYSAALIQIGHASEGVGTTQEKLAIQMQATSRQMAIAKEQFRVAAEVLGSSFAPAIVNIAQAIGSLATSFSNLDPAMQSVVSNFIVFGFTTSLAIVSIVKIGSVIKNVIQLLGELRIAFTSARAAMLLDFGPIGIALGAIAFATVLAINSHEKHARAVRDLNQAFADLNTTVQQFRLAQVLGPEQLNNVRQLIEDLKLAETATDNLRLARQAQLDQAIKDQAVLSGQPDSADALFVVGKRIANLKQEVAEFGDTTKVFKDAAATINESLNQPNVNIQKLTDHFEDLLNSLKATGNVEAFASAIKATSDNIGDYAINADKATDGTDGLGDSLDNLTEKLTTAGEFFQGLVSDSEDFRTSVANAINAVQKGLGQLPDVTQPFEFIKALQGIKADNIFGMLLALQKVNGAGEVFLTAAQRHALELGDALTKVEAKLSDVDGQIQRNSDDMSMWNNRIQLVDDTIGTAADGYDKLNELLNTGRISQEQYNEILKASIELRERSVGGVLDERAEQALLLPVLNDYVKAHDDAAGNIGNATNEQRGFIAALQDSSTQMALNTAIMLKMLEAMGLIPKGVATKFLLDVSQANPLIKAVLEDIGFIDGKEATATVNIKQAGAGRTLDLIEERLNDLEKRKVELQIGTSGDGMTPELRSVLDEIDQLTKDKQVIELGIENNIDSGDLSRLGELIRTISTDKEGRIHIVVKDAEARKELQDILGITIDDKNIDIQVKTVSLNDVERRVEKAASELGLETPEGGFVQAWRARIEADHGKFDSQIATVQEVLGVITGDPLVASVGIDTKEAQTTLLALVDDIDQKFLTPDFIASLDTNNDGALDATEIAVIAANGFATTYKAYLTTNAATVKEDLKEVDGVKVKVLKDGRLKITANSEDAMQKFKEVNAEVLTEKEVKIKWDLDLPPALKGDGTGIVEGDIVIPTSLDTPKTDKVDNFEPPTVNVPTSLSGPASETSTPTTSAKGSSTTTLTVDDTQANADIAAFNKSLDELDTRDATATITVEESPTSKNTLTALMTNLNTIDTSTYDVDISVGSDSVSNTVEQLTGALAVITASPFDVELTSTDSASEPINTLKAVLDAWPPTVLTEAVFDGSQAESDASTSASNILANLDITGAASSLGSQIGDSLGSGINPGAAAWGSAIAATVVAIVNTAVAAGRSAAEAKSPSRKTARLIGLPMSQGIASGAIKGIPLITSAMKAAVDAGVNAGIDSIGASPGLLKAGVLSIDASSLKASGPLSIGTLAQKQNGNFMNVKMDVTVPAANFPEWLDTVGFVQDLQQGFGISLAARRGR